MRLLDLTLCQPEQNLALDEALLEEAHQGGAGGEVLRIWEPREPIVVIGRSSRAVAEVDLEGCQQQGVPVLRRVSGGSAIVAGPGCLMYAVVLSYHQRPDLRSLDAAHRFVLETNRRALSNLCDGIERQGTSDLAVGPMKFSGNSLRCKRNHLLYHGTLLYDFRLELVPTYLRLPERQPEYRQGRGHEEFVMNLPTTGAALREELIEAWSAHEDYGPWPAERVERLVAEKYSKAEWNLRA